MKNTMLKMCITTIVFSLFFSFASADEPMCPPPPGCEYITYTPDYGLDTTDAPYELTTSDLNKVSSSNNVRYQTQKYWYGNSYTPTRYLLFEFPFDVIPEGTVEEVDLYFEWLTGCPNVEYAQIQVWDESAGEWETHNVLSPPTSPPTSDRMEHEDITSYINTPEDLNNIQVKFQAHDGYGPGWTKHDLVKIRALICESYCGDGNVDPEEECELPDTGDNGYCSQDTEQCDGTQTMYRDAYGYCDGSCFCLEDPWNDPVCVMGSCGAECDSDDDCDDLDPHTTDTCNLDFCECEHEYIPYCGDGNVDPAEECELPGEDNNTYCGQDTEDCDGTKTMYRDAYGYCDGECGCVEDPWSNPICVEGNCGAECDEDSDCDDLDPHTIDMCNMDTCGCEHEYVPYCGDGNVDPAEECELPGEDNNTYCDQSTEQCDGVKTQYRDEYGYCDGECGCVEDPWSNPVCVAGNCGAQCAVDADCDDLNPTTTDTCNLDTCECEHEYAGYCGDGYLYPPEEECELNDTEDNQYCDQNTEQCGGGSHGHKVMYRDAYGYCDGDCGCIEDPWGPPVCEIDKCGAECDGLHDCENYCEDTVRHYNGHCGWSWSCLCEDYQTEDCSEGDGWYETDETNGTHVLMEYRAYYCEPEGCGYDVTDTQWQELEIDTDGDGIYDHKDNCPETYNPKQEDLDGDGVGDACDDDIDGDGVPNEEDAFPTDPTEWEDTDGDGMGDNYDTDDDNDGIPDEQDNCPKTYNPDQEDLDQDGIGNACDDDIDGDGIPNDVDEDDDGDGIPDEQDNCAYTPNPGQEDLDGDGMGDVCDDDIDGDGVPNEEDAFPTDPTEWEDTDGDGIGDNSDNCPDTPNPSQTDSDGDGIGDACDNITEYCGDGNCGDGENCANCPADCGCSSGYQCVNGQCIVISKKTGGGGGGSGSYCTFAPNSDRCKATWSPPETVANETEEVPEENVTEEQIKCYRCAEEVLEGKTFNGTECPEGWTIEEVTCWGDNGAKEEPIPELPAQSNWAPESGTKVYSDSLNMTFTMDKPGDCKWSFLDQGYDDMPNDCTGDNATNITCPVVGMLEGVNNIYVACQDMEGRKDTAETNTHLQYNYTTGEEEILPATGLVAYQALGVALPFLIVIGLLYWFFFIAKRTKK